MMYENKRNGMQAELIRQDKDLVTMKYPDGKVNTITISTFKRWWKLSDIQPESTKVVKKRTNFKEDNRDSYYSQVNAVLGQHPEVEVKKYEKLPNFILLKKGKKTLLEVKFGRRKCVVNVRKPDIYEALYEKDSEIKVTKEQNNYYLPCVIELDGDIEERFSILLNIISGRY